MTTPAVVGLDLGTSSAKAVILDSRGHELGRGGADYRRTGDSVAAEVDPRVWWDGIRQALAQALSGCQAQVLAVGLSGQMHGVVAVDSRGAAVRPAITWQDIRSAAVIAEAQARTAPFHHDLINLPAPGLTSAILCWLARAEPASMARTAAIMQPKDWLGLRLTGSVATESTDASATGLWHFGEARWHREACAALGVPAELLPAVLSERDSRGGLLASVADEWGLPAGIPVSAGRADTAASLLGSGLFGGPGSTTLTLGTGAQLCQILRRTPSAPAAGLLAAVGPSDAAHYTLAGVFSAGQALDWVRRLFSLTWAELFDDAFSAGPAAQTEWAERGPICVPFVAGERIYPEGASLSASWMYVRAQHSRADLLRAAVEGTVYTIRAARDMLVAHPQAEPFDTCGLVGGGSRDPRMRRLVADVLGVAVRSPDVTNSSARGAALGAAVAAGWCSSLDEAAELFRRPSTVIAPDPGATAAHDRRFDRFTGVMCQLGVGKSGGQGLPSSASTTA